jgi:hypothetical protein
MAHGLSGGAGERRGGEGATGSEPATRAPQLGGHFPEGVRRQPQVASTARTAQQQVPIDVH